MNAEKRDRTKKNGAWKAVHEAFNTEVPEHLEYQLQNSLNAFRQDMREHPYVRRLERHGFPPRRKFIFFSRSSARPLLWVAMGSTLILIVSFLILANKPPTWAQVQERFGTMPFVAAKIYIRDIKIDSYPLNPLVEPRLVEVWAGYGNRMRIRSGKKMTFADKGQILNTFDLVNRTEADTDSVTYFVVNKFGKSDTISLDVMLRVENPLSPDEIPEWFPKGFFSKVWSSKNDTTPLVISDPVVSKELVVFDHEFGYAGTKTLKARVWALRESRLPIRVAISLRDYDDRDYRLIRSPIWDMIFTYSKKQPEEFFDPEAFAAKLKDPAISIDDLLYMFHQYPGGDSLPIN
ncbi:MAG: hypothetical protein ACWGNO_07780 [Desulfobacterales bacterium]